MVSVPQLQPESRSENQDFSHQDDHVFHLARFYRHLEKASAVLERQMQRGAPPHIRRVFCQIQAGLLLAAESVRHAQRSSRHG
jgi:hypothetical protein